jgi:DedD protein
MAQEQQDVDSLKRRGRRRLVGAVALVLLAVIVLPMVFDQAPRQDAPPVSVRIPGEDEAAPFKPKPQPPAPRVEAPKVEIPKVEAPKLEQKKPEPPKAADKERARAEAALAGAEQYVVPVGTFSQPDGVVAKLKAAKMPHYTERLQGNLTRVRAGPFPSRDAADKALQKLKSLGLEPGAVTTRNG